MSRRTTLLVGVLLMAFAVRLLFLEARVLTIAEGTSLTFARIPITEQVQARQAWQAVDLPGYELALGGWLTLVGGAAFAARLFSVFTGVIAVALVARIVHDFGAKAWVLAALAAALLPPQVHFSRVADGVMLLEVGLLALVALRLAEPRRRGLWALGVVGATALVLGSGTVGAAIGLLTLNVWAVTRGGRELPLWIAAQAVGLLLWVPYLALTYNSVLAGLDALARTNFTPSVVDFGRTVLSELVAGPYGSVDLHTVASIGLGLIAILGYVVQPEEDMLVWGWVWFGLPVIIGFGIEQRMPIFEPRDVIFCSAAVAVGVGLAVPTLDRRQVGTWSLLVITLIGLQVVEYTLPQPEPDLRPLAHDLALRAESGDGVLYTEVWHPGMLRAYRPSLDVDFIRTDLSGQDAAGMRDRLAEYGRLWLLTYEVEVRSSNNSVGRWLLGNAAWDGGTTYAESMELSLFAEPSRAVNAGEPQTCIAFGEGLFDLCYTPFDVRRSRFEALPLVTFLRLNRTTIVNYRIAYDLRPEPDAKPYVMAAGEPRSGTLSTSAFEEGELVQDARLLDLSGVPPGEYRVYVSITEANGTRALTLPDGQPAVFVGRVVITD